MRLALADLLRSMRELASWAQPGLPARSAAADLDGQVLLWPELLRLAGEPGELFEIGEGSDARAATLARLRHVVRESRLHGRGTRAANLPGPRGAWLARARPRRRCLRPARDSRKRILLVEDHAVVRYRLDGTRVSAFGNGPGPDPGVFNRPTGITSSAGTDTPPLSARNTHTIHWISLDLICTCGARLP